MGLRHDAHARRDAGDPRWAAPPEDEPPSASPYAHTYAAIAATERRRPSRRRRWAVLASLLALAGAATLVAPLLPERPAREASAPLRPAPRTATPSHGGPTAPTVVDTAPSSPKTRLHVDQPGDFAVVARGGSLRYGWTLDGRAAGTGPRWVWTPGAADVGTHTVEVTVLGPGGGVTREWKVRVEPPPEPPPVAATARPEPPFTPPPADAADVESSADAPVALAALPPVEGAHTPPVAASPVRPEPPRTAASPPLEPPPAEVAARAPLRTETPPRTAADAPADVSSRPDPPSPRRPSEDARVSRRRGASGRADGPRGTSADVRRWLQRWAAAWNTHDVDALRRMGQMATARDAEAVRRYLAQVSDLEVSVNLVELREEGERVIVRFIRRDRFRDPAGRLVEHESPPIEKVLLRTGDGFRVVHGRG